MFNYIPADSFSSRQESTLSLTEGCSIGDELLLDFCLYTPEEEQQQQQQEQQQQQQQQQQEKKKKQKQKQTAAQLPSMVSCLVGGDPPPLETAANQ